MNTVFEKLSVETEIKQKKQCIYLLCFAAVIVAFISEYPSLSASIKENALSAFVFLIPATATGWASVHERAKGSSLKGGWWLGILFLVPIFFPLYLIKDKGLKVGLTIFLKSIVLVIFAVLLFAITSVIFEQLLTNT